MRIAVDMDEVLADTSSLWLSRYNKDWEDNLTREDIKDWGLHQFVKEECGDKINNYMADVGFFLDLTPLPGAVDGMRKLVADGHDVLIATAVPRNSKTGYEEKLAWIRKHMPFFDMRNFSSVHRKDWVGGDVLLDDGLHNLESFRGISVRMERPWNRHEDCWDTSVKNWDEFLWLIEDLRHENVFNEFMGFARKRLSREMKHIGERRYEQRDC